MLRSTDWIKLAAKVPVSYYKRWTVYLQCILTIPSFMNIVHLLNSLTIFQRCHDH